MAKGTNPRGTVQVYTGIGVRGLGNNVSDTLRGVNGGEGRVIAQVSASVNRSWKARLRERQERNRIARGL